MNAEIDLLPDNGVGSDGNLREQAMLPIALDSLGNLRTRHADGLTYGQT